MDRAKLIDRIEHGCLELCDQNKECDGECAGCTADQILSLCELTEAEKKHISNALQKVYGKEWCSCCDEISRKLQLKGGE